MKIAIYGLPCAGKTHMLEILKSKDYLVVNGSEELNRISNEITGGKFREISKSMQQEIRMQYTKYIEELHNGNTIITDGHYSFGDDVVFNDEDGDLYDVIIYLYCKVNIIKERLLTSDKNKDYLDFSIHSLKKWQDFEIDSLRLETHKRNKDFYVIDNNNLDNILDFIVEIEKGFSSYKLGYEIYNQIKNIYSKPTEITLVDGDKTIIKQDSFRYCCNGKTKVFDNNFYTGYQSFLFYKEVCGSGFKLDNSILSKIDTLELNNFIFEKVSSNYVVLSAGIKDLWAEIKNKFSFINVIANQIISADTKYFVTKLLIENGYTIKAYGDSKVDIYMLKKANKGYLYINESISKSLIEVSLRGVEIVQDLKSYILVDNIKNDSELAISVNNNIDICKSNSGITGSKLAEAHLELGRILGRRLKDLVSSKDSAILILERGGRFFGDGLYLEFGGKFYPYNSKIDEMPKIQESTVIIVDSVINTGKSIRSIIERLKEDNKVENIIIVSNVIQSDAFKYLEGYKVLAVRVSNNFFIGKKQTTQFRGFGPDTADRLFNLI